MLGDGRAINFWSDRWCGEVSLQFRIADVFNKVVDKRLKVWEGFDHSEWSWGIILRWLDLRGSVEKTDGTAQGGSGRVQDRAWAGCCSLARGGVLTEDLLLDPLTGYLMMGAS